MFCIHRHSIPLVISCLLYFMHYIHSASLCRPSYNKSPVWGTNHFSPVRGTNDVIWPRGQRIHSANTPKHPFAYLTKCIWSYNAYIQWPRKNATLTINNFKKTRDRMKKLCALLRIKFFFQQDDTKIVNFDEGVLILEPFF